MLKTSDFTGSQLETTPTQAQITIAVNLLMFFIEQILIYIYHFVKYNIKRKTVFIMLRKFSSLIFISLFLTSCQDDGDCDGNKTLVGDNKCESTTINNNVEVQPSPLPSNKGVLIDSPIKGVYYKTDSLNGFTNTSGEFLYNDGESVTFSIGDIKLGSSTGASYITPIDLISGATDINHRAVINMIRLLQTLDDDFTPSNGIGIPDLARYNAIGQKYKILNFNVSETNFENNDTIINYLSSITNTAQLVDKSDAIDHFKNSLINIGRVSDTGDSNLSEPVNSDQTNVPENTISVSGISIEGEDQINEGESSSYKALINFSDGSSSYQNVTWNESSNYASVNSNGEISTVSVSQDQTLTLTASYEGIIRNKNILIKNVPPEEVSVYLDAENFIGFSKFQSGDSWYASVKLVNDQSWINLSESNGHWNFIGYSFPETICINVKAMDYIKEMNEIVCWYEISCPVFKINYVSSYYTPDVHAISERYYGTCSEFSPL